MEWDQNDVNGVFIVNFIVIFTNSGVFIFNFEHLSHLAQREIYRNTIFPQLNTNFSMLLLKTIFPQLNTNCSMLLLKTIFPQWLTNCSMLLLKTIFPQLNPNCSMLLLKTIFPQWLTNFSVIAEDYLSTVKHKLLYVIFFFIFFF